jgi:hypothetical protein
MAIKFGIFQKEKYMKMKTLCVWYALPTMTYDISYISSILMLQSSCSLFPCITLHMYACANSLEEKIPFSSTDYRTMRLL